MDCCRQEPEEFLSFRLEQGIVEVSTKKEDSKAELTAQLILEVFNLKNTGIRIYAAIKGILRAMLRRESKFAAFKREYIRENAQYYPQLIKYCDFNLDEI